MKSRDISGFFAEGNLASDSVTKQIGDSKLTKFRICISNGEKRTTYIDCDWWNPNGAVEFLRKGKKVFITGRLFQDEWEDKDTSVKQQKFFIGVERLELRSNANPVKNENSDNELNVSSSGNTEELPF